MGITWEKGKELKDSKLATPNKSIFKVCSLNLCTVEAVLCDH